MPDGRDVAPHWRAFARQWALLASPLRPCAEDVRVAGEMLGSAMGLLDSTRLAWLLGVTPELATANWLAHCRVIAVERAQSMIDALWPGNTAGRLAICADWRNAPLLHDSVDLVVGDGCLTVVDFPRGLMDLLKEVHRCLRADGYLLLRLFCRPDVAETPDQVIAALLSGQIASIHAFKWRLLMAAQASDDAPDVAVAKVWRIWDEVRSEVQRHAMANGWSSAEIGTMELYRDSRARYNFMTFDTTAHQLRRAGFDLLAKDIGTYELAERCPHVLLRKRGSECGAPAG